MSFSHFSSHIFVCEYLLPAQVLHSHKKNKTIGIKGILKNRNYYTRHKAVVG